MIMPRGQASGLFVFPDYPPSISLTVINPSPCLPSPERSIYDKRDCLSTIPIGVGELSIAGSPPSEPYVRFSRIRLSRKQVSHLRDRHNSAWALTIEKNPCLSKMALG